MTNVEKQPIQLKLKKFLPYRLSVLSNLISHSISEKYEQKFSLTTAEWRTLAILGEETDLSAAEVVERTAMDKVAISRAVNNLLSQGRLERHFSPEDRRRSVLALSTAGRKVYEQIAPLALSSESEIMQNLTDEEQQFLDSVLDKLNNIYFKLHNKNNHD
jgi:DNA-binding MarR family transcriptional regulator